MTLIKSHPEFKIKRAQLIIDQFGLNSISANDVDTQIRYFDKIFDRYNELSRKKIPANQMYQRVLQQILQKDISENEAIAFRNQADALFLEYTPLMLNENIPQILSQLCNEGYILNLASNTGFIEGKTLRQTLTDLQIFEYFSFSIFSDEVNSSKPSSYFFEKVYEQISVPKSQVMHIGDNPKTDYQGACSYGFRAMLLTSSDYSLTDIKARLLSFQD